MEGLDFAIYCVDDDEDDCLLIRNALSDTCSGTKLVFFVSGEDLLDDLSTLSEDEFPAFILLDLNMPTMSGLDVLQTLRSNERLQLIPVLILSGTGYKNAIKECYRLGANAFLSKPSSFAELADLLTTTRNYWLTMVNVPVAVEVATDLR